MTDAELDAVEVALVERLKLWRYRGFFPDTGPLRRELYVRHLAFFRAGKVHRERLFMAANRIGKTIAGSYESMLHLTGRYPDWWEGRVFDKPVRWTASGTTLETMRDIVQAELMGGERTLGQGMIPGCCIQEVRYRPNTNKAMDLATIKHVSGGNSLLSFKSYDQGRKAFEGTAREGVWLDEEPPQAIYTECLTRTATTGGITMITFTPLNGATDVVMDFIENAEAVT